MTPAEAIRRLGNLAIHHRDDTFPENEKALQLGTEALKRCRWNYLNPQNADFRRLPGETEE